MERYKNLNGNSGIVSYEIGNDSIMIQFRDSGLYLYDSQSPGITNVEHMKSLAISGRGLNSFISTTIRKNYSRKLR